MAGLSSGVGVAARVEAGVGPVERASTAPGAAVPQLAFRGTRVAGVLLRAPLVRPEGRVHLVGGSPTRAMVGWPGSWQAAWLGNWLGRSPATKAALGGRANRWAVTCVKPEQASKGKLWTPTRPEDGEGSTVWGSSRQGHLDRSTGVRGTARRDRGARKRGRPALGEGSGLNGALGRRLMRASDRVVVLLRPGNAGGGKGPDFWCVCQADEVR
jgi:hypothetical protein